MAGPHVILLAVGRLKGGPEKALFEHYAHRLRWALTLREVEERRPLPPSERKRREGDLLLQARPSGARLVALDGGGKALSSDALADQLGKWLDRGDSDIAFAIGGADGLDGAVLEAADLVLSLGPQTWPHMMVRAMLSEQLYRAQQILAGHPYHRE